MEKRSITIAVLEVEELPVEETDETL